MRLLFKLMVCGFAALVILPSISPVESEYAPVSTSHASGSIGAGDALTLAVGVANDVRGICVREPALCDIGQRAVATAVERAKQGAVIVGSMVEEHRAKQSANDDLLTGSVE